MYSDGFTIDFFIVKPKISIMRKYVATAFFIFSLSCCTSPDTAHNEKFANRVSDSAKKICLACGYNEIGDNTFNDMQYNGLIEASRHFNIKIDYRIPKHNNQDDLYRILHELSVEEKCDLIITSGFLVTAPLQKAASQNPETCYVILDNVVEMDNIVSVIYAQNEGSFVVGALAALVSKTKKVGFIGGVNIPVIEEFLSGFKQGIAYTETNTALSVRYCSKLPDYSGFSNAEKGEALAGTMYEDGVDIIFAVAGGTNNGIIASAKKNERFVIGVDSNQDFMAKGHVLTSMMKRLDNSVIDICQKFTDGSLEGGSILLYSYKNNGISITDMEFTKDKISSSILKEISSIEQKIKSGEIQVHK